MRKKILISAGIVLSVAIVSVILGFSFCKKTAQDPTMGARGGNITGFPIFGTATTSPEHLATSTDPLIEEIHLGDSVSNVALLSDTIASSSSSTFNYDFYSSYDGLDWYDMGNATSTTASSTKVINLGTVNNRYLKVEVSASQDNGAIYTEAIIKSSY